MGKTERMGARHVQHRTPGQQAVAVEPVAYERFDARACGSNPRGTYTARDFGFCVRRRVC